MGSLPKNLKDLSVDELLSRYEQQMENSIQVELPFTTSYQDEKTEKINISELISKLKTAKQRQNFFYKAIMNPLNRYFPRYKNNHELRDKILFYLRRGDKGDVRFLATLDRLEIMANLVDDWITNNLGDYGSFIIRVESLLAGK